MSTPDPPSFDLKALRYYVAVAEEENVSRAAERLHVSQSPLSRRIMDLEARVGANLFERRNKRLYLTYAGRQFLRDARAILAMADEAAAKARRTAAGSTGRLECAYVEGAIRNPAFTARLRAFHDHAPDVHLAMRPMGSRQQEEAIRTGALDVAFVHSVADGAGLDMRELFSEPLVAALPIGHPLLERDALRLAMLAKEAWVVPPPMQRSTFWSIVTGECEKAGFRPSGYETAQVSTALGLVASGLAVGLFQRSSVAEAPPGIATRPVEGVDLTIRTSLVTRKDHPWSLVDAFRTFVDRSRATHPA